MWPSSTLRRRLAATPRPHRLALRTALLLSLATAAAGRVQAATYYVDRTSSSCSDAGSGSAAQPYCTVSAAVSRRAAPGNVVLVSPGVYPEQVTVGASGASGNPFVIRAVPTPGAPVVIDGADDYSSTSRWRVHSGSVWLASSVSWNPKQVIVDGVRLQESKAKTQSIPVGTYRHEGSKGLYVNVGGGNPGLRSIFVGRRDNGFRLSSRAWVTIEGFMVRHSNDRAINVSGGSSTGLAFVANAVELSGAEGIYLSGGSALRIEGNRVTDAAAAGIRVSNVPGLVVRGNEVLRSNPSSGSGDGILISGSTQATVENNLTHHNGGAGIRLTSSSHDALSRQNRSWDNAIGFEQSGSQRVRRIGDVAWRNTTAGFSIVSSSTSASLHDCIATDNGLASGFDLTMESNSTAGFTSDYNLFWNSTPRSPVRYAGTAYATVAAYAAATGKDPRTLSADPRFVDPGAGDFRLSGGSPAIDSGNSGASGWPSLDAAGRARMDDPYTPNTGSGSPAYADRGALEFEPEAGPPNQLPEATIDQPTSDVSILAGETVRFEGTGTDRDGDTPLGFAWSFGGGAPAQAVEDPGEVRFETAGVYSVTLVVTDTRGGEGTAQRTVTVTAPPQPPRSAGRFVSPSGRDDGPGTIADPWRTISASVGELAPGDTLYVRAGTYRETPSVSVSGTAALPIVIRSYPGETAVLDPAIPELETPGNGEWELVNGATGEYRTRSAHPQSSPPYGYVAGIPGYANERVVLVPYTSAAHFRATTEQQGSAFYVGPGTFQAADGRIHIRLAKTADLRATEARYGTVFAAENADPADYSILISQASHTLRVTGSHLVFLDLVLEQARNTIVLGTGAHHLRFEGVTAWLGDRCVQVEGANVHAVTLLRSRFYGDHPYWIFWSDMKDAPAPADRVRATSINLMGGAHDWEIAYCHVRGSGQDLIGTGQNEYDVRIHHNRLENAGDDALELEGALGRAEVYENLIVNCLTAAAPGQDSPGFTGPLFFYRNVVLLLRDPPINREPGINTWNGGGRFGFEYALKQSGSGFGTRNVHYYHNTMVMLGAVKGMALTPQNPADTRVANNLLITVNGDVNPSYLRGAGQVVNGNLYWKMNPAGGSLAGGFATVPGLFAATGLEAAGLGALPGRGTDPRLADFPLDVVDAGAPVWALTPSSERLRSVHVLLSETSPARGAGIVIAPPPNLTLPDSRSSRDIGAIPFGTPRSEFESFPFQIAGDVPPDPPANHPPVVSAGTDQSITLPLDSILLDGTVTDDGLPAPPALATAWSLSSGPAAPAFADSTALDGSVSFPAAGRYVLRLTASDGERTASDSMIVDVLPGGDPGPVTTFEARIGAGANDAEERGASIDLASSDLELIRDATTIQKVWLRFTDVAIPRGSSIARAWIQFKVDEADSESTTLAVRAEASAASAAFTTSATSVTSRALTAAAATWSPPSWLVIGAAGQDQRTSDLAALVREVVNLPAWTSGGPMTFVFSGTGKRTAEAFEGDAAGAPLLHVEYTPPPPGPEELRASQDAATARTRVFGVRIVPQPARGRAVMHVSTPVAGPLRVELYDLQGRRVGLLADGVVPAGDHAFTVERGAPGIDRLGGGMYFYRVTAAEGVRTGRIVVLGSGS